MSGIPLPELAMAPILSAWTLWLIHLRLRRGGHRALGFAAVIFGSNAASLWLEVMGIAVADGKWAAVATSAILLLWMIRATWRPEMPDSRRLVEAAPPDPAAERTRLAEAYWRGRAEAAASVCLAVAADLSEEGPASPQGAELASLHGTRHATRS